MKNNPEAEEARLRLGAEMLLSVHLYTLSAAFRALLANHPNPELVRQLMDQLTFQMQCHPGFLSNPDCSIVLKDFVETLFQPPEALDKDYL